MIIDIYKKEGEEAQKIATLRKNIEDAKEAAAGIGGFIAEALGGSVKVESRISKIYVSQTGFSTMTAKGANVMHERGSAIIGRLIEPESPWQEAAITGEDGNTSTERFGIEFSTEGYVLSIGKEISLTFGGIVPGYIAKITQTKVRFGAQSGAKVFASKADMLKFVKKNEAVLSNMVSLNGWQFSCEPASTRFLEEDVLAYMSLKPLQKEKVSETENQLKELLSEINGAEDMPLPYTPADTPHDEAVARMKAMDMWENVIEDYKSSGKIYQSINGIIYTLDEEAQAAVEDTKKYGLPYHVVLGSLPDGCTVYSVLYVSEHKELWPEEQYDRKTTQILTNTWMPFYQDSEIGTISVLPSSGGLRRIA